MRLIYFKAYSKSDAEDGIKFMQEMIELAKQRNDDGGRLIILLFIHFMLGHNK